MDIAQLESDLAGLDATLSGPPRTHGTHRVTLALARMQIAMIRHRLAEGVYDRTPPVPVGVPLEALEVARTLARAETGGE